MQRASTCALLQHFFFDRPMATCMLNSFTRNGELGPCDFPGLGRGTFRLVLNLETQPHIRFKPNTGPYLPGEKQTSTLLEIIIYLGSFNCVFFFPPFFFFVSFWQYLLGWMTLKPHRE